MDLQIFRRAGLIAKAAQGDGVIDGILGHVAIGSPFAAGDGEQAGGIHVNGVIAGDGGSAGGPAGFHQRTQADIDGEHVGAARRSGEVAAGCFENEFDLLVERLGFEAWAVDGSVGCAGHGMAMPGNDEEDAAIAGAGNHEGGVALEEGAIEDEVDALAGNHQRFGAGIGHAANVVREDAGGIDHDFGA